MAGNPEESLCPRRTLERAGERQFVMDFTRVMRMNADFVAVLFQ